MAAMAENIPKVLAKLEWMREQHIWPNGLRYLWTDAHGVCLLVSLYKELQEEKYLQEAESVVADVYRVLGRPLGLRIGEEPDRDGQYFHYLTKWMYALYQLGKVKPEYHERAVKLAKDVHHAFYVPGVGVRWKMLEDLSGPYPGYGLGGLDFYDGFVTYRLLDPAALSAEIVNMQQLVMKDYKKFSCTQDLGLGECLWMSHFFPDEEWAKTLRQRSETTLNSMWVEKGGLFAKDRDYFCREPGLRGVKFAFTNFGVSLGLQAAGVWPERVEKLHAFFENYKSNDEYDTDAITHVMHCNSLFPGVLGKD